MHSTGKLTCGLCILDVPHYKSPLLRLSQAAHPSHPRASSVYTLQERLHIRLLHPQHLGGIWSGLTPYMLPFDTLIEYPEPWLQETRGSLS